MTSFFWSTLLLVATGATGATARKEFSYDVIFLEYLATGLLQVLQLARSLAMTSFFLEYLATGLLQVLQVLQLARSLAMTSFFLEYLATGLLQVLQVLQVLQLARSSTMTSFFWITLLLVCYRCYSSQGV